MKCEHKDGWFLAEGEDIVINPDLVNDNNIAYFECNHLGCNKRKKFKFDITNIREVEE